MTQTGETWTVRRLLEWTSGFFTRKEVDQPRLSAELLLAYVLNTPRIRLYTDYERPLGENELAAYRALVKRAGEQEPIAYLTGRAHFFGLEFAVNRDVLIPRPDTETLVEHVLQTVRYDPSLKAPRILDLCTGSGCIAAALASRLPNATVLAIDISPAAVELARQNIERLKLESRVQVECGDLFEPLSRVVDAAPFDLLVANPPYIRSGLLPQLDRSVRDYEPAIALDGGVDGLDVHRRILAGASKHVVPRGQIFLEIAYDQRESALAVAGTIEGLTECRVVKDSAGNDRVLIARRAP
jgi:release factor glutamine methyltransferase